MDVSIGSIVKVMQSFTTAQSDGETVFVKANERFVVLDFMGGNAEISSLRRSLEMVVSERFLSRYFLSVQPKVKERDWSMYLPKRFLEEATDECAALDVWQLKALIDIALDTGDKEWFNELHSKLSTLD